MVNKSQQQVQVELETIRKEMASLQREQTRLQVLEQFQRKGVTQAQSMPFTAGNGQR